MTPKIKLLIWKIKHGALPVGEVLRARQIIPNSKCIRCDCSETIIHLFFHCEFARKVWELIPVSGGFNCDQVVNFDAAWKSALQATVLPPIGLADTSLAPWIISSIWTARNFLIFQKRQFSAQETMVKEICDAKEWKSAQSTLSPPTRNTIYPPIRHNYEFTCRSDAAWKKELNSGGVAWSFYNSSGERINSHSEPVAFMEHAIALQLGSVIFESDSLQLVAAIVGDSSFSEIHEILSDIRILSTAFVSISFRFIHRENLKFEDSIAKQALSRFVVTRFNQAI
ncbi:hypothetical protein Bca52824_041293 [Brassica carinata]|uniref:Reverse transcriptase zinc-binding domain-containing protein n=1 Tax=Brassica carinata TaxID=52824 RepID=A0A8X7RZE7_BRACI|nr:hypothetical protein Bca52824_041293 [Brassica carinata]